MGKHGKKQKKQKRHCSTPEQTDGPKLLKYAALAKKRKVRAALAANAALLNYADTRHGTTALHQACRHGHADVVSLLLRRHADPNAADAAGNTPGHLAAMHGHWTVLLEFIQHSEIPVNLAAANHAGLTIKQIMQRHNEGNTAAAAAKAVEHSAGNSLSSGSSRDHSQQGGSNAAAAIDGNDDDAAWRSKLAYEMSDDEYGWGGGLAGAAWGEPLAAQYGQPEVATETTADSDDDDAWADRLWKDMQDHRRQTAAAAAAKSGRTAFTGFSRTQADRDAAAQEKQRRAEAAAAESARILKEEQAKDLDWRATMMRQIEQATMPNKRDAYEAKWAALLSWPTDKTITYSDVPWPPCLTPGSSSHSQRLSQTPQPLDRQLELDTEQLRKFVFAGATGPDSVKLALRKELMRWHPDKFGARFGSKLAAADKASIFAAVHAVAQQLTSLTQA